MKAQALLLSIPFALLLACSRSEPPVTSPESSENLPIPAPTTPGAPNPAAGTPTNTAAAEVTLNGAPNTTATPRATVGGSLQLVTATNGVQLSGQVTGLPPNSEHGFHVHEFGDCSAPDFASAGAHFNPDGAQHGNPMSTPHHLGDIPSIKSDAQGVATVNAAITAATLKDNGPHDLIGKSIVVHAKRDDYTTQPSGDSGDRIACGVIDAIP